MRTELLNELRSLFQDKSRPEMLVFSESDDFPNLYYVDDRDEFAAREKLLTLAECEVIAKKVNPSRVIFIELDRSIKLPAQD